ncbi:MAG: hypothetical protein HC809_05115 [Gammaproteobacteria bacterium]|nr:hypothetical protein [Gammaproteobacteria bacterium]
MTGRQFATRALDAVLARGFDKARVVVTDSEHHELGAEFGHLNLLRTNHNTSVSLLGIVADKQGSVSINKCTDDALTTAIDDLWQVSQGARPDPAHEIAEAQPTKEFSAGPSEPDQGAMVTRLQEFLDHCRTAYPTLRMGQAIVSFTQRKSSFLNSNGVAFTSRRGNYHTSFMFTAKDGKDTSSFSYTGATLSSLDAPLASSGDADTLMRQTTEQVRTRKGAKFVGDLILTPHCLDDFLGFLTGNIADPAMIAKTSIYYGKLGETVAAPGLNFASHPQDLIGGYFLTGDGYPAANTKLVDKGVLRSYLLSLYGARKLSLRGLTPQGAVVWSRPVMSHLRK